MKTSVFLTCVVWCCVSRQLEYNNLTEVNKGWLYGLRTLQQLHLSHNSISRIKPDSWEFCQKLAQLWVTSFPVWWGWCDKWTWCVDACVCVTVMWAGITWVGWMKAVSWVSVFWSSSALETIASVSSQTERSEAWPACRRCEFQNHITVLSSVIKHVVKILYKWCAVRSCMCVGLWDSFLNRTKCCSAQRSAQVTSVLGGGRLWAHMASCFLKRQSTFFFKLCVKN